MNAGSVVEEEQLDREAVLPGYVGTGPAFPDTVMTWGQWRWLARQRRLGTRNLTLPEALELIPSGQAAYEFLKAQERPVGVSEVADALGLTFEEAERLLWQLTFTQDIGYWGGGNGRIVHALAAGVAYGSPLRAVWLVGHGPERLPSLSTSARRQMEAAYRDKPDRLAEARARWAWTDAADEAIGHERLAARTRRAAGKGGAR